METPPQIRKRTRFSLSKKGVISFVFSKFAFLVFGVMITAAFFFIISAQKDMQQFDELARTGDSIANIVGMASASPFEFSIRYEPRINATLNFTNQSFSVESEGKRLGHALYFPIKTNTTIEMLQCINITRTNVTEVFECQ